MEDEHTGQTNKAAGAGNQEPQDTTCSVKLHELAITAVICLGAGLGAAYFVIKTQSHMAAEIFLGTNGAFMFLHVC